MLEDVNHYLRSVNPLLYDQFTIDWIEDKTDRFVQEPPRSESERQIETEALHYEVQNILEIMHDGAEGKTFFQKLNQILESAELSPSH